MFTAAENTSSDLPVVLGGVSIVSVGWEVHIQPPRASGRVSEQHVENDPDFHTPSASVEAAVSTRVSTTTVNKYGLLNPPSGAGARVGFNEGSCTSGGHG